MVRHPFELNGGVAKPARLVTPPNNQIDIVTANLDLWVAKGDFGGGVLRLSFSREENLISLDF
jgi:hypothetical protein